MTSPAMFRPIALPQAVPTLRARSVHVRICLQGVTLIAALAGCSLAGTNISSADGSGRAANHPTIAETRRVPVDRARGVSLLGAQSFVPTEHMKRDRPNLRDLVHAYRPVFFHMRGGASTNESIPVYLDGVYTGGADVLASIPSARVRAVHRLSAASAVALSRGTEFALYLETMPRAMQAP